MSCCGVSYTMPLLGRDLHSTPSRYVIRIAQCLLVRLALLLLQRRLWTLRSHRTVMNLSNVRTCESGFMKRHVPVSRMNFDPGRKFLTLSLSFSRLELDHQDCIMNSDDLILLPLEMQHSQDSADMVTGLSKISAASEVFKE